jgi:hypothetical protein
MDQQDSLPSQFIYQLIALAKSYHMLVRNRQSSDIKGRGINLYLLVLLLCVINLYVENIKNVIIECFLLKIILKNSIKSRKDNSILTSDINIIKIKHTGILFTLNRWILMCHESRNISLCERKKKFFHLDLKMFVY